MSVHNSVNLQIQNKAGSILLLFVLVILLGASGDNPDRAAYVENYDGMIRGWGNFNFEPGYQLVVLIFSKLGMSFEVFSFFMALTGILFIFSTVTRYSSNPILVLTMYASYPLFWDYVQVRNFLAMSIFIYGARFLFDQRIFSVTKFIFSILVASTFHISALIYISFLLVRIKSNYILNVILVAVTLGGYLGSFLIFSSPFILTKFPKIALYGMTETSLLTQVLVCLYYVLTLMIVYIISDKITTKMSRVSRSHDLIYISRMSYRGLYKSRSGAFFYLPNPFVIKRIFLISVIFLPFVFINLDFMRLYRNLFILISMCLVSGIWVSEKTMHKGYYYMICIIYSFFCFFGFVQYLTTSDIITPLYSSNYIVSWVGLN